MEKITMVCVLFHERETRGAHLYKEIDEGDESTISNLYIRKTALVRGGVIRVPKAITVSVEIEDG